MAAERTTATASMGGRIRGRAPARSLALGLASLALYVALCGCVPVCASGWGGEESFQVVRRRAQASALAHAHTRTHIYAGCNAYTPTNTPQEL